MDFWFRLPLRTRIGVIATVLMTVAVVVLLSWYFQPDHFSYRNTWVLRIAPMIFLFWLAWEDIKGISYWNWLFLLILMIICSVKPGFWLIGIPLIGYTLFFSGTKRK